MVTTLANVSKATPEMERCVKVIRVIIIWLNYYINKQALQMLNIGQGHYDYQSLHSVNYLYIY